MPGPLLRIAAATASLSVASGALKTFSWGSLLVLAAAAHAAAQIDQTGLEANPNTSLLDRQQG